MIGGIGLMCWVLAWQVSRIVAITSATCASSTPTMIEALRFRGGRAQVGVADADVKVGRVGLESVPPCLRPPAGARETDLYRNVEEKGAVGYERADGKGGDLTDRLKRNAVTVTLVHDG